MTIDEVRAEALRNARDGESVTNYPAIFAGFMAKGIAEGDILPRENILTFQAWKAVGRSVKKGEHGVKVVTFVPIKDRDTGEVTGRAPHATTVFHVSQTESTADAEARWAANKANREASPENRDRDGERRYSGRRRGYSARYAQRSEAGYVDPGELAADRWNEQHGDRWSDH